MKKIYTSVIFGLAILFASASSALAAGSLAITELTPSNAEIFARNEISFKVVPTGFNPTFSASDSFPGTTMLSNAINSGSGRFYWSPNPSDVGTHTITITGNDYGGNIVTITQTVVVKPPPSIAIEAVSPGKQVMPGSTVTFQVVPTGFTNPTYSVNSSMVGSSAGQVKIDSSGKFTWTPQIPDTGDHVITVYANDSIGHSDDASVDIRVGAGPSVVIQGMTPASGTVTLGQSLSLSAGGMNYTPTSFTVKDSFPNSTLSNGHINTQGQLSWVPSGSDVGSHKITVIGTVGFFGQSASTEITVCVLGQGQAACAAAPTATPAATTPAATPPAAPAATGSDSAMTVLQAQLAALQAQIASAQGGSAPASPSSASSLSGQGKLTMYLFTGLENDEVMILQNLLKKEGYLTVEPNGYFGPATKAAVAKFQTAKGLDATGTVGPKTRAVLNGLPSGTPASVTTETSAKFVFKSLLSLGDSNSEVKELQKKLKALGYFSEEATGYFGALTKAAVVAFQKAKGIDPRGHVGPATRAELNK